MSAPAGPGPVLARHILRVGDLAASTAFYRDLLGMQPVAETAAGRAVLAFAAGEPGVTLLELRQGRPDGAVGTLDPRGEDAYWKVGITLADVDLAREILLSRGVEVSRPQQFRDIGYLCHLADPDGFQIELLQHHFEQNHEAVARQEGFALGGPATLGQVTLRVRDPEASLRFYRDLLGLRLLSRQAVAPYRFTLYFLAGTDERPPLDDLDAVGNREWLWQRPYTTLELQHRWGTEDGADSYRTHDDQRLGFEGLGFLCPDLPTLLARMADAGVPILPPEGRAATVQDPDGNRIRLFDPT